MYGVDDALLIAGLAATAAGTGMGMAGNAQAQNAMSQVRSTEAKRQTELQNEANQVFNKNLSTSGADTAKRQIDQGTAQRQSIYNALKQVAQPTAGAPLPDDSNPNPIVNSQDATPGANRLASTRGNAWTALTSGAAAREGGYQDYEANQAINNADTDRRIGVISNRARGWANIMPLELEVASHKGDALSGWGQLVSALGSVAGVAGATGAGSAVVGSAAAPTAGQTAALDAGFGPVSASYAGRVAPEAAVINNNQSIVSSLANPWSQISFNR